MGKQSNARVPSVPSVPRMKLGSQGLEVSRLGYGCAGLSGIDNSPVSEEHGISTIITHAFHKGITFFDAADAYGSHANEILIGKALKRLPREKIQLATKFGSEKFDGSSVVINGRPDYVRACCEASLKRLGVDYIDLYYHHCVDKSVPIEETMRELGNLVEEGKLDYIGLSEASPETIRRAYAVHSITAVQIEWSLCTRDIEGEIIQLCREFGIGIVTYSPLGGGFFAGKGIVESLPPESLLIRHPNFSGDNLEKNKLLYACLDKLAVKHHCTPGQLALAWLLHQGSDVVPILGTTKVKNLEGNIGSLNVSLTGEDLKEISDAVTAEDFAGERLTGPFTSYFWQFTNTPPKDGKTSS